MSFSKASGGAANTNHHADTNGTSGKARRCWPVFALAVVSAIVHLWGIRQDLPFALQVDEPMWVGTAARMAAESNLNPKWFGHPGSTILYPLAAMYRIWQLGAQLTGIESFQRPLLEILATSPTPFYLLGRVLTIALAVLTLPMTYRLGKCTLGEHAGLAGAFILLTCELAIRQALLVRSDSATMFFGTLGMLCGIRLLKSPGWPRQAAAGLIIGLAVSTKYYMLVLVAMLIAIDAVLIWRQHNAGGAQSSMLKPAAVGLVCVALAFALTTPYLLIDWETAIGNILIELRSTHPGADGLSSFGNFAWYMKQALPSALGWPRVLLMVIGVGTTLASRRCEQLLLLSYSGLFLLGISLSSLHWAHWIMAILPVLALLAGEGCVRLAGWGASVLRLPTSYKSLTLTALVIAVSLGPGRDVAYAQIRRSRPSTQAHARRWVLEHIPMGTPIAQEGYTAPLAGAGYPLFQISSLDQRSLEDYYIDGYHLLLASSYMYDRFYAEPERYRHRIEFYEALGQCLLLAEFAPSRTIGGPTVRLYSLDGCVERDPAEAYVDYGKE